MIDRKTRALNRTISTYLWRISSMLDIRGKDLRIGSNAASEFEMERTIITGSLSATLTYASYMAFDGVIAVVITITAGSNFGASERQGRSVAWQCLLANKRNAASLRTEKRTFAV
jgi:hypothetical protein